MSPGKVQEEEEKETRGSAWGWRADRKLEKKKKCFRLEHMADVEVYVHGSVSLLAKRVRLHAGRG